MSLEDKLAKNKADLEAINALKRKFGTRADLEKVRKERDDIALITNGIKDNIVERIDEGLMPRKEIEDYHAQNWIKSAMKDRAKHQDIWDGLMAWAATEGISISVRDEHDGVGIRSWIAITTDVLEPDTSLEPN